jgi:hypothetical protein
VVCLKTIVVCLKTIVACLKTAKEKINEQR